MPTVAEALERIAAGRRVDPLAPVTVIVPSRLAGLQLRRRLAQSGPFAGVRFETLARIAELLAAAELARRDRRPLARPIADYVTTRVALESQGPYASVRELPGYARALRQTFRRLRRGGLHDEREVIEAGDGSPALREVARLYGRFRGETASFYDSEDLLETAAEVVRTATQQVLPELGDVYVLPPSRLSAGAGVLLDTLRDVATSYVELDEEEGRPEERFILAPDTASEARAVARRVVEDLENGVSLNDVAVFTSGDRAYRAQLYQALTAAGVPVASMPGVPLIELPAGRGALALANVALQDYARTAVFDFVGPAPLPATVPGRDGSLAPRGSQWLRIARQAGVTHGSERWRLALGVYRGDRQTELDDGDSSEGQRRRAQGEIEGVDALASFVEGLIQRLEPLRRRQPAAEFIPAFRSLVEQYLDHRAEGYQAVLAEIDQLGTIDAVGGSFDLESFTAAFEANLSIAAQRTNSLGQGVLLTDYRAAAGLSFRHVYVCGAYEGAFPAAATSEPLLQDEVWSRLRDRYPQVEDLELRLQRANEAARRLLGVASEGTLTWSAPLQAANGTREYYPSSLMTEAAHRSDPTIVTASDLRRTAGLSGRLQRSASPLASLLRGRPLDTWEQRLRETITIRRQGALHPSHPLARPVHLLRSRRSAVFSEFDGNLTALAGRVGPLDGANLSPTALEDYAACGFRFFLRSILRLRGIEEPEEEATMSPLERGNLMHQTLQRFFMEQQQHGRPRPGERWNAADLQRLLAIFEEGFEHLRSLGRTGLEVYTDYDRSLLRSDLAAFLESDSDFRQETGAVPHAFELHLEPSPAGPINLHGYVDRIDRSPDGSRAWVIDYKTGSASSYRDLGDADPFLTGTRLQLPVYMLAAADAAEVEAFYWFITRRGEFKRVGYRDSPAIRERFAATVQAIVEGARAGAFPAIPGSEDEFYGTYENCRYCDFDRICSRRRIYEAQEKSEHHDLAPWRAVAVVARGEQGS